MDFVIEAPGLKIYDEGEWKTHKHGREKTRRWIKVHAAVDPESGECVAAEITDEKSGDSLQFSALIKNSPSRVKTMYIDGAMTLQIAGKSFIGGVLKL